MGDAMASSLSGLASGAEGRHWIMGTAAFEARMPHHDGIKALWETKWKFPCSKSLYPFHDGAYEDFEPVFAHLIDHDINDGTSPAYTQAFMEPARRLAAQADEALEQGDKPAAQALYLRACALLRIARFPYITAFPVVNDAPKWEAFELQKELYARMTAGTHAVPIHEVDIPHRHATGRDRPTIPVYVRYAPAPPASSGAPGPSPSPSPVVILMTGLDGYRPDNTVRLDEFLKRGWASVTVEIPGTAECPADSADPASPDRLWSSVLDWLAEQPERFDMARVMVWGLSSGGYYAIRIAHTHRDRLAGSVAQGAGSHYFFDRAWLARADGHEYPFQLTPALAMKHGFDSVQDYLEHARQRFSLLDTGILHMPSTRLLLINGTLDGLMPIEDSMLLFDYGSPKEARFFPGAVHMGYPLANNSVYPWMESVMESARRK